MSLDWLTRAKLRCENKVVCGSSSRSYFLAILALSKMKMSRDDLLTRSLHTCERVRRRLSIYGLLVYYRLRKSAQELSKLASSSGWQRPPARLCQ